MNPAFCLTRLNARYNNNPAPKTMSLFETLSVEIDDSTFIQLTDVQAYLDELDAEEYSEYLAYGGAAADFDNEGVEEAL